MSQLADGHTRPRAGKFLTFFLGDEEYGIGILTVCEIIAMQPVTRVPRMPDFVRGVINLRGRVIPITDLRLKLGMTQDGTHDGCIVVVQLQGMQTGIVVDRVSEVVAIAEADIDDAPNFGTGVRSELLLGIGKAGGRVRLLLDIDSVLLLSDVATMGALSTTT